MLGKLRPQAATGGRLSDTTFSTDKDPLQGILLKDVLERGVGEILLLIYITISPPPEVS